MAGDALNALSRIHTWVPTTDDLALLSAAAGGARGFSVRWLLK